VLGPWAAADGRAIVRAAGAVHVTPRPGDGVWRVARPVPGDRADDLSAFAGGTLNFRLRTRDPRPLEVGFKVGSAREGSALDALMPLAPGEHGHRADGQWHAVSIPIATLREAVAAREKVGLSRIDLMRVTAPFVIGARRAAGDAPPQPVEIDDVHWAR
jgi:hypothetical protein